MARLTKASEREVRFAHRRMTHCASEDPVSLGPWASQAPASPPPECSWPWDMLSLARRGRGWLRPPRISEGRELLLWDAGCVSLHGETSSALRSPSRPAPRREEPQGQGPRPSAAVAQAPASAQHPLVRPAPGAMWGLSPRPHSRSPCPRGQPAAPALRAASPADGQRPLCTAPRQLLPLCLRHTFLLGGRLP